MKEHMRTAALLIAAIISLILFADALAAKKDETDLPILLFHHLSDTAANDATVTPAYFKEVVKTLKDAGYETVSTADLIAYTRGDRNLPAKPVMITFDDGYESNISLAAPILEAHGMQGVIFAIGVSAGKSTYKNTDEAIIPHFSWAQAAPYAHVLEIQSHTFDMHQVRALDGDNCRYGIQQMDNENAADYERAFRADFTRSRRDIEQNTGIPVTAFSYPYGAHNVLAEKYLCKMGACITMTTEKRVNTLRCGDESSLSLLGRFTVTEGTDVLSLIQS